ncbi:hypothetical protein [Akkermansia muciniphila]|jgi:hypothetical protein|uniref:hypothetical protein n=1 Tax=Akkermansia muciniphila TaxID=239935 RepID=UPI00201E5C34|nr:hypothetical protein [Akkermansia muciniphila]MCL6682267.1 hypothetical protein [Akkermansia muciniphila]
MKKFQCPLCGTVLQFFHELKFGGLGRVGCSSCEWVTFLASPPQAWKAAEKYISGFPPIMRVWPGDILQLAELEGLAVVVSVDRDNGKIYTDKGCCYIPDIIKWPWELGQKGGEA